MAVEEVQSALKDVRINLVGNQLKAYALFHIYGKDIALQLEGTLAPRDGYVRLTPTAGKLGALPIPQTTLGHVVAQLFESPQNREKFRLPQQIQSIRVENGTSSSRRNKVCLTSHCCIFTAACFFPATGRLELDGAGWQKWHKSSGLFALVPGIGFAV